MGEKYKKKKKEMESGGSSTRPLQEEKRELELGRTHCKVGTQQVNKYKRDKLVS